MDREPSGDDATWELVIPPEIEREFRKLKKRDPVLLDRVEKKLEDVLRDPFQFGEAKRFRLKGCRGVHIGPFVLLWVVEGHHVIVVRFAHHDHAYG